MLDLIEQIARSPHAGQLFAIPSMHTLLVAGATPFHTECEVLRIDYDADRDEFRLEYVEQPHVHTRWRKQCTPGEAFGGVEHLARMKGWIPPAPRRNVPIASIVAGACGPRRDVDTVRLRCTGFRPGHASTDRDQVDDVPRRTSAPWSHPRALPKNPGKQK
ncbi:MAG TPA: hypothetical protein VE871_03440 [Longimicrobium sp.]|nr:hypothetical protein [Longimicrobium sp.]